MKPTGGRHAGRFGWPLTGNAFEEMLNCWSPILSGSHTVFIWTRLQMNVEKKVSWLFESLYHLLC